MQDIDTQCHQISSKSDGSEAHLHSKGVGSLVSFDWNAMLQELLPLHLISSMLWSLQLYQLREKELTDAKPVITVSHQ